MLGTGGIGGDERQVDLRLLRGRKLNLGLLRRVAQPLQRHLVALGAQVKSFVFLELIGQPLHDAAVNVVATQVGIAIRGFHLDDTLAYFQDGNIKRAAAEIVDRDGLIFFLVETIGQGRRRGLVDDALHIQPGDPAGIFCSLALRVVKVRRHGDHRFGDRSAQVVLGRLLQLLQDHR